MSPTPSMSAFSITVRSLCTISVSGRPRTLRLRVEKLLEALAVAVEQRLRAADVERHGGEFAADQPALLVEIELRHGQRLLDHRLDAGREPGASPRSSVMLATIATRTAGTAAIDREQPDDAHMQPRAGAAAAARLHDVPDFPADDGDQQQRRERVERQDRDDDLMGRRDRREAGQHREGHGRRQQRQRDRERADQARRQLRRGRSRISGRDVVGSWPCGLSPAEKAEKDAAPEPRRAAGSGPI